MALCLPACDPVDPTTCAEGLTCYAFDAGAVCIPDAGQGQQGDACEHPEGCDPDLLCVDVPDLSDCPGILGCCTAACDVTDPACPDGLVCVAYYGENDPTPKGSENLGACIDP